MLGDTAVGKTSLVLRFVEGSFKQERPSTVGAFFVTKRLLVENSILCKISIWDTAGQPQFRPLAKMYYEHAAAAILCFSYSSRQSWQVTKFWLEELQRNVPAGNIVLCLCACKSDMSPHVVSSKEAQELAVANGALLLDTSAARNHNVSEVFLKVAERVLQFQKNEKETGLGKIPVTPGAVMMGSDGNGTNKQQPKVNRYGVVVEEEKKSEVNSTSSSTNNNIPSKELTPARRDKRTRSLPVVEEEPELPQPSMCGIIPAHTKCTVS
jgi:Ras-related protein Rab-5C